MCYNGEPHDLLDIYSIDVGAWNEERTVWWCKKCGSVCIAKASDGRTFGYVGKMRFPEYLHDQRVKEIVYKKRG